MVPSLLNLLSSQVEGPISTPDTVLDVCRRCRCKPVQGQDVLDDAVPIAR